MKTKKKNKIKLRCALIFLGPFPIGNVSTIRILSYCKALAKKNIFIKVLLIAPTKEASINKKKVGEIDGVKYEYITHITWKRNNPSIIVKCFYYILGLIKSINFLRRERINCLLSYHDELISNFFYAFFCRILKIKFIIDKTEYPKNYFTENRLKKEIIKIRLNLFNKYITITKELELFYKSITGKKDKNFYLLPITIDKDRYKNIPIKAAVYPYIALIFGTHNRDGLFNSVKAYKKYFNSKDDPYKLMLIGDYIELCRVFPENKNILNYIKEEKIEDYVIFKGLVSNEEIPSLLVNAKCLLTTPTRFNSGGFPTKLGEYLLSGVPVVATKAGEISNYLIHNENALLSPIENLDSVAENILFIHNFPEEARRIADAGRKLAERVFNADSYIEELISFLTK